MNIDFAIGLHIVGFLTSCEGKPVSSTIMAKSFGTNPVVLRRILSRLNQSGLVKTTRGANGGSVLARDASEINLREIYESACVAQELFARHPEPEGVIASILGGYINEFYAKAETAMLEYLESLSVADMDAEVRPKILAALKCK